MSKGTESLVLSVVPLNAFLPHVCTMKVSDLILFLYVGSFDVSNSVV